MSKFEAIVFVPGSHPTEADVTNAVKEKRSENKNRRCFDLWIPDWNLDRLRNYIRREIFIFCSEYPLLKYLYIRKQYDGLPSLPFFVDVATGSFTGSVSA